MGLMGRGDPTIMNWRNKLCSNQECKPESTPILPAGFSTKMMI
jgi:hypothetical protein